MLIIVADLDKIFGPEKIQGYSFSQQRFRKSKTQNMFKLGEFNETKKTVILQKDIFIVDIIQTKRLINKHAYSTC